MKEHQTPCKDISHLRSKDSPSSKPISDYSKKHQKTAKKSLNPVFSSVSEDLLTESVTESFNFPESEILNDNHQNGDSVDSLECLLAAENYSLAAVEPLTPSDSASSSKITTVNDESVDQWLDWRKEFESNGSADPEIVVVENLLKQARLQVLSSTDIHPGLKKLLDALIEVSVREFCALPVKRDRSNERSSKGCRILVLCFMVFLVISMSVIVFSGGPGYRSLPSFYPQPT